MCLYVSVCVFGYNYVCIRMYVNACVCCTRGRSYIIFLFPLFIYHITKQERQEFAGDQAGYRSFVSSELLDMQSRCGFELGFC